jgi:DMSO/TMAO reductase YedYZ molybdopterin-dependent catalytic subunit
VKGGDERHGRYYESIDLIDAFHPQTILAYSMNGRALSIAHGAPYAFASSVNSDTSTPNT